MARREKLNLGFQRPRALSKSKLRAPGCYTQNFLRPRYRRHLSLEPKWLEPESYFSFSSALSRGRRNGKSGWAVQ